MYPVPVISFGGDSQFNCNESRFQNKQLILKIREWGKDEKGCLLS